MLWKPVGVVSAFLLLLTYFLIQSRNPDMEPRARIQAGLQALALHDAELTRDVLQARAGLLSNYDSLTRTGGKLREALDTLHREGAAMSGDSAQEIGPHIDALARTLQDKLTVVEYFKSDNALLRNSSTYFAHAGKRLGERLRNGNRTLAAEIAALSQAMLELMHSPEGAARDEAHRALERLTRAPTRSADSEALTTHGWLIVGVLPQVDGLIRQIVEAPTAALTETVQDVVHRQANRSEARAQVFRILLYLAAVVLLAYLLYQFGRLRASHRALGREMAERQQAAAALRISEERFRAITESANDAIISADGGGRIVSWNRKAEVMFGYRADEVPGVSLVTLMPERYHRDHDPRFAERVAAAVCGLAGRTLEFAARRKDGTEFPVEISFSTWSTAEGQYATGMVRDLTARKQLEETTRQQELQLIQANKMTAVGTLVSGVAHEINNPNQVIQMSARVLSEAWSDALARLDARHKEDGEFSLAGLPYAEMRATIPTLLEDVHEGASRIARIVGDLKDFARPPASGTRHLFVMNDVVQRALRLLAHAIRSRTRRFEVVLAGELPPMEGDAQQVEQIVVNLVMNALEALPDQEHGVRVTTAMDVAEGAIVLQVCDEGVGIPPEDLAHLCDPFFTTKRESGGTGLGLAITSSLVRLHGGRLTFSSEPGRGTCAMVTFSV